MEHLFGDVALLVQQNPWLAVAAVFAGGITTALNPCVLAMIPLMIGLVAGAENVRSVRRSLLYSGAFVLGLAITFTALGLISGLLGRMFGDVGAFWRWLVVAVCLIMGLHLLGALKFELPIRSAFRPVRGGPAGAFLLGLLFGLVSTPCAMPVLAVILALVSGGGRILYGGLLLFVYALGHSLLILAAGTSMGAAKALIESRGLRRAHAVLQKAAGGMILLIGAYFLIRG